MSNKLYPQSSNELETFCSHTSDNEFRSGAVDGWDFKNYVLGTMFYRYISENLTNYINSGEQEAGNNDFDYTKMSDVDADEAREGLVEEKGFFILPSELFCNVNRESDNDENLNETLERVFNHIESSAKGSSSESSFAGLFDDFDVNSNKLGSTVAKRNERLAKLLHGVANMNLGDVKEHDIGFDKFDIACEDTLTVPQHWDDEPFELIVSNPPYSIKWAGDDNPLLIIRSSFLSGRCSCTEIESRPCLYHALSFMAGNRRYGGYRLLPRHNVPWRCGAED